MDSIILVVDKRDINKTYRIAYMDFSNEECFEMEWVSGDDLKPYEGDYCPSEDFTDSACGPKVPFECSIKGFNTDSNLRDRMHFLHGQIAALGFHLDSRCGDALETIQNQYEAIIELFVRGQR